MIYAVGFLPIPVLPLVALTVGYIGVLAVGRAWVLNEKERTLIAKKLKDGDPDAMPDLRWTALVSALQLLILWPLIFMQVQRHFGLYTVPEGATFWTWLLFTLDSYNKAVLGLLQVYGVHFEEVGLDSAWGRHLVTLCRLTFGYLLIQGVFRLIAIRQTVREAVLAVRADPDMAVRLGKRAVKPLIAALQEPYRVLSATYEGDFGPANRLCDALDLREGATRALGELWDVRAVEPLIRVLGDEDNQVRAGAASALGELRDGRAVRPLIAALQDKDMEVRVNAADALGALGSGRRLKPHRVSFHDPRPDGPVSNAEQAVEPLITALLQDPDEHVRASAAASLGKLKHPQAGVALLAALQDGDEQVRQSAAAALRNVDPVAAAKTGLE